MAIATPTYRQRVDDVYLGSIVSAINRPPTVVVKRTSTLSITLNTDVVVTWQAEQTSDLDAMADIAGAPTLVTIKTAGWFLPIAQVTWNSTTTTTHEADLLYNGTTTAASVARKTSYGAPSGHGDQVIGPPTLCAVNDVWRLLVRTSATLSLQTSRGGTWLALHWLGYGA